MGRHHKPITIDHVRYAILVNDGENPSTAIKECNVGLYPSAVKNCRPIQIAHQFIDGAAPALVDSIRKALEPVDV